MNKKLILTLLTVIISAAIYGFVSIDHGPNPTLQHQVSGKDAEIATQFVKFIDDLAKKNDRKKFEMIFKTIPQEELEYSFDLLKQTKLSDKPVKITSPTHGNANKYYVYYTEDNTGNTIRFEVKKMKKRWDFKNIREIQPE